MEPQSLNILDYSVLSIILLSGLLALMRGFVREVLSLAAWAAAYFIAANYYMIAEPWTHKYVKNLTGATAFAAVLVFVAALTVLTIAGYFAAKLIRGRALTAIDRSLGFFFGLLRGVLIVCLIYLGATYIPWLNMDKLDNPQAKPQIQEEAANPAKPDDKKDDDKKDKDKPPEWLVEAKTRPALAYGAGILKVFIPEKEIEKTMEKTMQDYSEQNAEAHRAINDQAQDMLGIPGKPSEKPEQAPTYDNQDRTKMDQLFNQQNPQQGKQ